MQRKVTILEEKRLDYEMRLDNLDVNMRDCVDLIHSLDEKILAEKTNVATVTRDIQQKFREIERSIVDQLASLGSYDGELSFNFQAHENSMKALEDEFISQQREYISFREQIQSQFTQVVSLSQKA